jgi:tetratricopeptide (TPR) repeat protein
MRRIVVFFILASAVPVFAQNASTLDSVRYLIQNYQYQPALEKINRILPASGSNTELYYLKGLALKGNVKYTEAISSFSDLLRLNPNHVTALIELGNCYKMLGDFKHAYSSLILADSLSPNVFVKTEMANILYSTDQFDLAEEIYQDLLKKDSLNVFLLRNIGKSFEKMSIFDSAMVYYEKAMHLNPYDFHTAYPLCNIYVRKKAYQKAIDVSEKYLKLDSTDILMKRMNAYLYLLKKDYKTSLSCFKNCYENRDTSVFTIKYLGVSYFKLNIYDTAKIYLEKAFLKDTMDAQTCNFLGIACAESYWKKLGIEYLKRAILLINPDPVYLSGIYTNLAEACNGYSKYDDALAAFLKAYELNPADTLLPYRIAKQYDRWMNNKELAIKYYTLFLQIKHPPSDISSTETDGKLVISYYNAAKGRIKQLMKDLKRK